MTFRVPIEEIHPALTDLLARRPELRDIGIAGYLVGSTLEVAPGKPRTYGRVARKWVAPSGERGYASAAETLIAEHGCWTGDAPADMAGKWPGGAIVRKANGTVTYTERPQMVDRALRQALDGEDTGLWAVAFCRGGVR